MTGSSFLFLAKDTRIQFSTGEAAMSYQFLHIETYSRKPKKADTTGQQFNSVDQVFGEAIRSEKYSKHVDEVQAPLILKYAGAIAPTDLKVLHDEAISNIRLKVINGTGKGYSRRLKTDAKTLYTEIHSHPAKPTDLKCSDIKKDVDRWLRLLISDYKVRMPEGIAFSVILHLDESHVHCHILAVNLCDPKVDANKLHVGKVAAAKYRLAHAPFQTATSLPKPKRIPMPVKPRKPQASMNLRTQSRNSTRYAERLESWIQACADIKWQNENAYKEWQKANRVHLHHQRRSRSDVNGEKLAFTKALKSLQDHYIMAVGQMCGLLRTGPRSMRLATIEASARNEDAKRLAKRHVELDEKSRLIQSRNLSIRAEEQCLVLARTDIDQQRAHHQENVLEFIIAQEAVIDAMQQFARSDLALAEITFHQIIYDAYETDETKRTSLQQALVVFCDYLVENRQAANSSAGRNYYSPR